MGTTYKLTPLNYIREGEALRASGKLPEPHDDLTLAQAFIAYAEFMEGQFFTTQTVNKRGAVSEDNLSVPMQLESFRLFTGIRRDDWDKMANDPQCARAMSLIHDAVYCQQMEGALIGAYMAKMVQLIQERKEQLEVTGTMAFEQITGIEVK